MKKQQIDDQAISQIYEGLAEMFVLLCMFLEHLEKKESEMDEKMAKVTKQMKVAEKDIKGGKPKLAVKVLKKAEKKNTALTKEDRDVRDPIIKKYKASHSKKAK